MADEYGPIPLSMLGQSDAMRMGPPAPMRSLPFAASAATRSVAPKSSLFSKGSTGQNESLNDHVLGFLHGLLGTAPDEVLPDASVLEVNPRNDRVRAGAALGFSGGIALEGSPIPLMAAPRIEKYAGNVARRLAEPSKTNLGGTVGMFYLERDTPRVKKAESLLLKGKSPRQIWKDTGVLMMPDGTFVEGADNMVALNLLKAIENRRPAARKVVADTEHALAIRDRIDQGMTPEQAARDYKLQTGNAVPDRAMEWATKNEYSDLEDALTRHRATLEGPMDNIPIQDIVDHPEMFARVPNMANTVIDSRAASRVPDNASGMYDYDAPTPTIAVKHGMPSGEAEYVLKHELQHGVSHRSGLNDFGTSPEDIMDANPGISYEDAHAKYMHSADEARANMTQNRWDLPMDERLARFPGDDLPKGVNFRDIWAGNTKGTPAATLRQNLANEPYTLKSLERLPLDRDTVSIQTLREQMNRPDVSKAEKEVLERAIAGRTGTVTADDLLRSVNKETANFHLEPADSTTYANYGLSQIGRANRHDGYSENTNRSIVSDERTTVHRLPEGVVNDTGNHFGDPNYFGHTRSFVEDGVPHVVEIQSDLVQKAGKPLSAEERKALEEKLTASNSVIDKVSKIDTQDYEAVLSALEKDPELLAAYNSNLVRSNNLELTLDDIRKARNNGSYGDDAEEIAGLMEDLGSHLEVRKAEIEAKLNARGSVENIRPMLKNWDRRLVNEELSRAAREREELPGRVHDKELEVAHIDKYLVNHGADAELAHLKARLTAPPVVRFATADTVAKVEGWQDLRSSLEAQAEHYRNSVAKANRDVEDLRALISGTPLHQLPPGRIRTELSGEPLYQKTDWLRTELAENLRYIEEKELAIANMEKRLKDIEAGRESRFMPQHQGIYDRYAKETTKYLKSLGGKEVTDKQGHTWIEVPVKSGRIPLFSAGAGVAAGAGAAYNAEQESPE